MNIGELVKKYWLKTNTAPGTYESYLIRKNRKRIAANCLKRIQKNSPKYSKIAAEIEKDLKS